MEWIRFVDKTPPMEVNVILRLTKKYTCYESGEEKDLTKAQIGFFKFRRPFDYNPDKYQCNFYQIIKVIVNEQDEEIVTPNMWKDFDIPFNTEWILLE